jgi:hypothetical protein
MANQIIVLGASLNSVMLNVSVVLWYSITSGAKTVPGVSAWPNASAAENTAIQNGSILEESTSFQFPVGTPTATMEAYLLQYWTNRNAQIAGVGPAQFANFGYNGTAWVSNIT